MRRIYELGMCCVASVVVGGCAVGPDYVAPEPDVGTFAAVVDGVAGDGDPDLVAWWRRLGDPALGEAIDAAVAANLDLRVASARLGEVRAMRRAALGGLGPSVGARGDAARARQSETTGLGQVFGAIGVGVTQESYGVGFDAAWELDLFGGVRRGIEAADARVEAAAERWRAVRLSIVAEVARVWIERAGAARRLEIAEEQVDLQAGTLEIVSARERSGLARELEVDQARAQLETSRAALPPLSAAVTRASYRLAVLLGRKPSEVIDVPVELPDVPATIEVGVPGALLRRRPDVRAAERELAAATADIGVATAELYPKLFVLGSAGLQSLSSGDLIESGSRTWQLGPSIRWRLFETGRVRAGIEARRAAREAVLAEFERAVLVALEDVEATAVVLARERTRRATLVDAVAASRSAAERASRLYSAGLVDFLTVLDAERRRNEVETAWIDSEIALRLSVVAVFKALGGGW